jgi:hypothetical protein
MVERVTVAFPQMREFIGQRVLLGGSFNAFEVLCVKLAMTLFLMHTRCQARRRTSGGIVKLALHLQLVMKMCGVFTLNSLPTACGQIAYGSVVCHWPFVLPWNLPKHIPLLNLFAARNSKTPRPVT